MLDLMSSYPSLLDEPDSDTIEMFCGQIPRTMSENELRILFEHYGRIYKLNILRDKQSGESKGCCFLTYYTRKAALHAQNALHNAVILPGMHHAMQMKPADIENRNERKIFIGMISKSCHEEDIKQLFKPFGLIEECTILRDLNNRSRGCAFVTYQQRQSALNAIKTMHQSCTMDGCSLSINVRFADTPKDKEVRKMQHKLHENVLHPITTKTPSLPNEINGKLTSLNLMLFNQLYSNAVTRINVPQHSLNDLSCGDNITNKIFPLSDILETKSNNDAENNLLSPLASETIEWQGVGVVGHYPSTLRNRLFPVNRAAGESNGVPINHASLCGREQSTKQQQHATNSQDNLSTAPNFFINSDTHSQTWPSAKDDDFRLLDGFLSSTTNELSNSPNLSSINYDNSRLLKDLNKPQNNNNSQTINTIDERQLIGPFGSNLFIYHLPSEFTDHDLAQTFAPFGNVLSAKVFIDRITNRSKCFGFVSYDNIYSAHQAIKQMNGFQIGLKRLKVQLKKTRTQ